MSNANNSNKGNKTEFSQWLTPKDSLYGHLYRMGEIPNCSPPLYGVTLSVPFGKSGNLKYETLDLVVTDARALSLLMKYESVINKDNKTKANISFRCYGLYAKESYTIKSGDYMGKLVTPLGGSLSHIYYLEINGEVLYSSKKETETDNSSDTENPSDIKAKVA